MKPDRNLSKNRHSGVVWKLITGSWPPNEAFFQRRWLKRMQGGN